MTNTTQRAAEKNPNQVDPNRILSETFAQVFRAYKEASGTVQEVIGDMCEIINDPEVDDDDREAAIATLVEALFPTHHNGDLGIGVEDLRTIGFEETPESGPLVEDFEQQEVTFAHRLKAVLAEKGITQEQLAAMVKVQQPAISMMLSRKCRPQKKTVARIAQALGMNTEDLWPGG